MSKNIAGLFALGMLTLVAACGQQEEVVYVAPEPIVAEPTSGKF